MYYKYYKYYIIIVMNGDALAKLKHNINYLRDEVINMKDTIIKRLPEEKKHLHQNCSDI